ncbi:MAG TPA: bifunctional riboflavin kinase/FAD synthetase [Actinomycetota bacterium]
MSHKPRTFVGLDQVPADLGPTAVTIGVFDGVHLGHQALLARVVEEARSRGVLPGAITFDRHPMKVVRPGSDPPLLSTLSQRVELLGRHGMEFVLVLPFTPKLSRMAAEEFAVKVLLEAVNARVVVVGANFRFGHKAAGDARLIAELARPRGVDVVALSLDADQGEPVSSTRVRAALAAGEVETVRRLLGRPFTVAGHVVHGAERGRRLGIPTANLRVPARLALPAKGVYAGHLEVEGSPPMPAVSNVGTSPQFGGNELRVETFVLDFDGDLYDRLVRVSFEHRIRDETVFPSVEALVERMNDDVAQARRLLGAPGRGRGQA